MAFLSTIMMSIALVLITTSIPMITAIISPLPPPVIFAFGDSLSDVGNNNFFPYSLAKSDYPWYGIDYITGMATGRFTNGRTIGDFISAKLGVDPSPPFLSLSLDSDDILKGVNYASGGAGILNETGIYFIQKLSFDDQIDCFEKTKSAIINKIGEADAEKLCNEALYFVGLGSNDFINNYMQPFLDDGQEYTYQEFEELLMYTLKEQLTRLYHLGARKVVFQGLAPLGCIPSQRVKSGNDACLEYVNEYALQFNFDVKKLLTGLSNMLPGAKMSLVDTYNVVLDLINNPEKYGFKVSNTSCCNVDTSIGGLCLPNTRLCDNRKDYVFWDAYHPTDAANEVIANEIFAIPRTPPLLANAPAPSP